MTEADRAELHAKLEGHPLLLYDGVCALCNGVVQFVLRHDRAGVFYFAALESEVGREFLGSGASAKDGVAVVTNALTTNQQIFRRSDAAIEALRALKYPKSASLLALMPRWLREASYGAVARIRYRLFGRYDVCPLPPPAVRSRFFGF